VEWITLRDIPARRGKAGAFGPGKLDVPGRPERIKPTGRIGEPLNVGWRSYGRCIRPGPGHAVLGAESTHTNRCGLHGSIQLLKKLCACRHRCNRWHP